MDKRLQELKRQSALNPDDIKKKTSYIDFGIKAGKDGCMGCLVLMEDIEPHTCPYRTELDEDYEFHCQCCECQQDFCSEEI